MTAGDEGLQWGFTGTRGAPFHAYPTPEKEAQRRELQNTEIKPSAQHQGATTRPARTHRLRDVGNGPKPGTASSPKTWCPLPMGTRGTSPALLQLPAARENCPELPWLRARCFSTRVMLFQPGQHL